MIYEFEATKRFWRSFYELPASKKASTRGAWEIFKQNPFDPRLGTHSIAALSAKAKHTIYSVVIEGNLRAVFRIDGNVVTTLDIGTHDIYK